MVTHIKRKLRRDRVVTYSHSRGETLCLAADSKPSHYLTALYLSTACDPVYWNKLSAEPICDGVSFSVCCNL